MTPNPELTSNISPQPGDAAERRSSGWDIRNAPRNYAALIAAHGATAFFSFASVWLITQVIGSEGYGWVVSFVAASGLAQIFLNWSSTALVRFGVEEFVETGRITRSFWSRTMILIPNLFLVLMLAGFWLAPVAGWLKIPEAAVWMILVHLFAASLWLHVQYAMQGVKMLRLQGMMLAGERVMTFTGLILAAALGRLTLEFALWCYIVPSLLLAAAGLFILRNYISLEGFFAREHFRRMLIFSLPLIPFALIGYLSTSQLDAFFINRFLETPDLGVYAVASQMNGMVMQLPIIANSILIPMFVSLQTGLQDETSGRYFRNVLPTLSLAWGAICSFAGVAAVFLIPLVFGPEFERSALVLWVLLAATSVSAPTMFGYAAYSHAISATYISAIASAGAAFTNIAFNYLLIPQYGLIGCAVATFVSVSVLNLIVVLLCKQRARMDLSWVPASILPPVLGLIPLLLLNSYLASFVTTLAVLGGIAYLFRQSIGQAAATLIRRSNKE